MKLAYLGEKHQRGYLGEEQLVEVLRLYEEHCGSGRGFEVAMHQTPSVVLESLMKQRRGEYRVGSKCNLHSKIFFGTDTKGDVEVKFKPSFEIKDRQGPEFEDAIRSGEEFVKAAMQYLDQQTGF